MSTKTLRRAPAVAALPTYTAFGRYKTVEIGTQFDPIEVKVFFASPIAKKPLAILATRMPDASFAAYLARRSVTVKAL